MWRYPGTRGTAVHRATPTVVSLARPTKTSATKKKSHTAGLSAPRSRTLYRSTSLIRKAHPPRITLGPYAQAYCRVLGGGRFLMSEAPIYTPGQRSLHSPGSGFRVYGRRRIFISQKVFTKSFCKSQFPHKFVNLSITITDIKNKLTSLCGNQLLQDDVINTLFETSFSWLVLIHRVRASSALGSTLKQRPATCSADPHPSPLEGGNLGRGAKPEIQNQI